MKNEFITLKNKDLEIILTPIGASIYLIRYKQEVMTLTPDSYEQFITPSIYYGKTIGPIANRVPNGVLTLENNTYHFDINEVKNSLHSGKDGVSNKLFAYERKENEVTFTLDDEIFLYEVIYLLKENEIQLTLKATAKKDYPIALTNHAYFCLGDDDLTNISLTIPSHSFVETESTTLLPLKEREILPCLDFNHKKLIMQDINDSYLQNHRSFGYDHCFLLDKELITLENDRYVMDITTDFQALQIYSDNYVDGTKMLTSKKDHHRGLALEPQDSLLHRRLLKAGETYTHHITYSFRQK